MFSDEILRLDLELSNEKRAANPSSKDLKTQLQQLGNLNKSGTVSPFSFTAKSLLNIYFCLQVAL